MIKLFIREKGMEPAKWWKNYVSSLPLGKDYVNEDLKKQCIKFKDNGSYQLDAWLEFKTEQQRNWFLLRWS